MNGVSFSRETAAELIRDSETFGSVLLVILLAAYGDELFDMDPLEIYERVKEDFRATITEEGENKLNAIMMAVSTDAFYDDPLAFRSIAAALYDGDLGDLVNGVMEDVTLPEMLWAVYEVGLLREEMEEDDFSPSVQRVLDEAVSDEAESLEDAEDPEDVFPYYERFVEDNKQDLHSQLRKLGLLEDDLNDLF